MLTDGVSISVPANSTVNAALGRPIEFIGVDSTARLFANADAAGVQIQVLLNRGGDQRAPVAAGSTLNTAAAAGQGPKEDEDRIADFAIPAGSRNQINFTNTTAGAIVARYRAIIAP